ncbi:right-handed parallel beta-helix repeat-containing protein [Massilia sp. YIM B02443]|uniref:right-handed parallel beta-helix repeat-containing protein n=1 Tax=Massilia sp. YIM B02443 TaxID=3050127 RepID=UPI0025B69958|nr:right-handed parallel beta-helix repeat-containing protein [Massilia sp. YIM B02443]MDN4039779.1 right-handed parallel beta-helix repeat-containing protein [Massilia sp. YIM B02443]
MVRIPSLARLLLLWMLAVLAVLAATALAGCRLRDGGNERLVVAELVRTHLYVAPGGSDSNPGTRAEPFRTLMRAAQVVTPGTTVHVAPGMYSGGVRTATNGTAEARIIFQSTERWGARIVPPLDARQGAAWDNRANYLDIIGFEIDGTQYQSGMKWVSGIYSGGSHNGIHDNHIHHIGTDVPCEPKGGAGIGVDSYYKGVDATVSGNRVHDIGPPGCRFMHGIYVSTTANVRNNVVYRISGAGIHLWHDASHVTIRGNTVAASGSGIVVGGGDFYHGKGPNDHTHVSNNIVYDNRHGILEQGATGRHNSFRNNLVYDNDEGDWKLAEGREHSGSVSAPPQFVEYSAGGTPDFRLRPGSPAIGRGLPAEGPAPASKGGNGGGPAGKSADQSAGRPDIGALPLPAL